MLLVDNHVGSKYRQICKTICIIHEWFYHDHVLKMYSILPHQNVKQDNTNKHIATILQRKAFKYIKMPVIVIIKITSVQSNLAKGNITHHPLPDSSNLDPNDNVSVKTVSCAGVS